MHGLSIMFMALAVLSVVVGHLWFLVVTFKESIGWGLGCLFLPLVDTIFLIKHWSVAKKPFAVTLGAIPFSLIAFLADPQLPEHSSAAQASAAVPTAFPATPTEDPSATRQDEQFQTFESNGCRLSAPATWAVQAEPSNAGAKLVLSDLTGKSSVGIHYESAAGTTLTKRDVAQLMEKANRMPLKLEDSHWSMVDNHEAWREVRTGSLGGSNRIWIRYSYHLDSAVVQVIAVAAGSRLREERELLETILRSSHCEL